MTFVTRKNCYHLLFSTNFTEITSINYELLFKTFQIFNFLKVTLTAQFFSQNIYNFFIIFFKQSPKF